MKNIAKVISIILFISEAYSSDRFAWLLDLKGKADSPPVVVMTPSGGFFAFWVEMEKKFDIAISPSEIWFSRHFMRVIDHRGDIVIGKREINPHDFSSKTMLWLKTGELLSIGQRLVNPYSNPPGYCLDRLILNSSGEIILGPETFSIDMLEPHLVRDSKDKVYVIDITGVIGVEIAEVYPELGECIRTPEEHWEEFVKNKATDIFVHHSPGITMTSEDKLLICDRLMWGDKEEIKGWPKRPNKLFYVLADLNGNIISDPLQFDLRETAFLRVPGIHLGGNFGLSPIVGATDDIDLAKLPNGEIILSVTGLDEKGELCTYQVKFTDKGELVKPDKMVQIEPKKFPTGYLPPVIKVGLAAIGVGGKVRYEYILFGFDAEGNFYEDRMVWKEEKR